MRGRRLTVHLVPPTDVALSSVRVYQDGVEAIHLEGIFLTTTATLRLTRGETQIRVTSRTSGGTVNSSTRTYRTCTAADAAPDDDLGSDVIISEGGGED